MYGVVIFGFFLLLQAIKNKNEDDVMRIVLNFAKLSYLWPTG